jgi:hypothetical protein
VTHYLKYLYLSVWLLALWITDDILDLLKCNPTIRSHTHTKKEFDNSKTYRYDQLPKPKKTSLPNLCKAALLDICSLQIKVTKITNCTYIKTSVQQGTTDFFSQNNLFK